MQSPFSWQLIRKLLSNLLNPVWKSAIANSRKLRHRKVFDSEPSVVGREWPKYTFGAWMLVVPATKHGMRPPFASSHCELPAFFVAGSYVADTTAYVKKSNGA